jgi:hypothetical protein
MYEVLQYTYISFSTPTLSFDLYVYTVNSLSLMEYSCN